MSDPDAATQANPHPVSGHRTPSEIAEDEAGPIGQPDDNERENSGLLERQKQKFAEEEAEKARASKKSASTEAGQPASNPDVDPASRKSRG